MSNKLKLLVTKKYRKGYPVVVDKEVDFSTLSVVNRWDYKEIMIVGGEPLLFPLSVEAVIQSIRNIQALQGTEGKIYLSTSVMKNKSFYPVLDKLDGLVYTPCNKADIQDFLDINGILNHHEEISKGKTLIFNLSDKVKKYIPEGTDLSHWKVINTDKLFEDADFCKAAKLLKE